MILMKGILASFIVSILISVSLMGCLGGDGETEKDASAIILGIDDFPVIWNEGEPEYFEVDRTDNYAIKKFLMDITSSSVEIAVMIYDSEDLAKDIYSNSYNYYLALGATNISIGDEGFILHLKAYYWGSMMICFRKGEVVVASIADYTTTYPITESWFISLMNTQESRI